MKGGVSYDIVYNTDTYDNNAYANNDYCFQHGWNDVYISVRRCYCVYRIIDMDNKTLTQ